MKKTIAFILIATMLILTLSACNKPCEEHVDQDGNLICDVCEEKLEPKADPTPPCSHADEDGNYVCDNCGADLPNNALTLTSALAAQLKNANTLELEFAISITEQDTVWVPSEENVSEFVEETYTYTTENRGSILIGKVDGEYHLRMSLEGSNKEGDTVISGGKEVSYLIGNKIYNYDEENDLFWINLLPVDITTTEMLDKLFEGISLTAEEEKQLKTALGEYIISAFNIQNQSGSFRLDLLPIYEDIAEYVSSWDLEVTTIGDLLTDALQAYDEELTLEAFLTEIERVSALTVAEARAELDAWLTENHKTTLQGLIDGFVADERNMLLLENILTAALENVPAEAEAPSVEDILAQVRAFNLDELIAEQGLADAILFDLFMLSTGPEAIPTPEQFFADLEGLLASTISEFEEIFPPILSEIKMSLENTTYTENYYKLDLGFTGTFDLSSFAFEHKQSSTVRSPSFVSEELFDSELYALHISISLKNLSNEATEVAPDPNLRHYYNMLGFTFYSFDETVGEEASVTFYEDLSAGLDMDARIFVDGQEVYIEMRGLAENLLTDTTITVPAHLCTVYIDGAEVEIDLNVCPVFSFDLVDDEFTVVQPPVLLN